MLVRKMLMHLIWYSREFDLAILLKNKTLKFKLSNDLKNYMESTYMNVLEWTGLIIKIKSKENKFLNFLFESYIVVKSS